MRALQYDAIGQPLRLVELPDPEPAPDGVVIAVHATGVCRSDWHAWQGHDPVPLPMVPGHEFAGTVHALGSTVTGITVGQRVTVPFVLACGTCEQCREGQGQVCPNQTQPGFTRPGSFAERVSVSPASNVVPLPDGIDDVSAAALGCRFATAYRGLRAHGRLRAGQWLVVIGCGGVGLSAVMIGAALVAQVLAVDVSPDALVRARELGATATLDAAEPQSLADQIHEITSGGAHVGMDAIGSPQAATASILGLRRRGRHIQVGLLLADNASPPIPMDAVISRELELYGSHGMAAHEYPQLLQLAAGLDLAPLVGKVIGLSQAGQALAELDRPGAAGAGMIVVDPRR